MANLTPHSAASNPEHDRTLEKSLFRALTGLAGRLRAANPRWTVRQVVAAVEGRLLLARAVLAQRSAEAPLDMTGMLAAIDRIEVAEPGFKQRLAVRLVEKLWRENPEALRTIAPQLADVFERRLLDRADQIARLWAPRDPRVREALRVAASDIGEPGPKAAWRAAKRQMIRGALFGLEHGVTPQMKLETAFRLSQLPDFRRLKRLAILLAEEQLCAGTRRSRLAGKARDKVALEVQGPRLIKRAVLKSQGHRLVKRAVARAERPPGSIDFDGAPVDVRGPYGPEVLLLAQEDEARQALRLSRARELVRSAGLSDPELDAFLVVRLLEIPLAEWAREIGRAESTARTWWTRAKAKIEKAKEAAEANEAAV